MRYVCQKMSSTYQKLSYVCQNMSYACQKMSYAGYRIAGWSGCAWPYWSPGSWCHPPPTSTIMFIITSSAREIYDCVHIEEGKRQKIRLLGEMDALKNPVHTMYTKPPPLKKMVSQKLLFKSSLLLNGTVNAAFNYILQTTATTFDFSSVFILLLWLCIIVIV